MYLKHTDAYGNELGLYRSIKEAASKTNTSVTLISAVINHNLSLQDGSVISPLRANAKEVVDTRARMAQALAEYQRIGTHPRFLAKKYNVNLRDIQHKLSDKDKKAQLETALKDWLASPRSVKEVADKHEVSQYSLSRRISKEVGV